jgi:hypothetical protein
MADMPREEDRPVAVEVVEGRLRVTLLDGRIIATPLEWYPRLVNATPEQLAAVELGFAGIHWPDLDEDLSVLGMLMGSRPSQPKHEEVAGV